MNAAGGVREGKGVLFNSNGLVLPSCMYQVGNRRRLTKGGGGRGATFPPIIGDGATFPLIMASSGGGGVGRSVFLANAMALVDLFSLLVLVVAS